MSLEQVIVVNVHQELQTKKGTSNEAPTLPKKTKEILFA
jgi:hypothetical protein